MRIVIHYLESIDGVAIFPIVGFIIFFTFFLGLLYYVYHLDKGFVEDMANSPLGNDDEKNDEINVNH